MATTLERFRKICLELPNTKETITWGEPHFRVGEKIFAGYGEKAGASSAEFADRIIYHLNRLPA